MNILHRLGITALVSAIEDAGLVIWLAMLHASPVFAGAAVAALTLLTFLTTEHLISQRDAVGKLTVKSVLRVLGFTAIEVVNWAVWLALIAVNPVLAAGYFLGSFFIEHQITYNVKKGLPFLQFYDISPGGSARKRVIVETVSELIGAALWVTLSPAVGVTALVIGSSIEHFIASEKV